MKLIHESAFALVFKFTVTHLGVSLLLPSRDCLVTSLALSNTRDRLENAKLSFLCCLLPSGLDFFRRIPLANIGSKGFSKPRYWTLEVRRAKGHTVATQSARANLSLSPTAETHLRR